jgi:hypothetical protein
MAFQTTYICNFALLHSVWQRASRGAANRHEWLQGTTELSVWSQGYLQDVLHTCGPSSSHTGKSAVEKDRVSGEASCRWKLRCCTPGPFCKLTTTNSRTDKRPALTCSSEHSKGLQALPSGAGVATQHFLLLATSTYQLVKYPRDNEP